MIIGIDGNEANILNRVGSNTYAYEILKQIWKIINLELKIKNSELNLEFRIYLKDKPLSDLPQETKWWQYIVLKPKFFWTQWRLPLELYLAKEKPDIFFAPGHYAPRYSPVPYIITIMDLAFLHFPSQFKKSDLFQLVNWTRYSVQKASHILTISEFTKREIIHFYHLDQDKITVTYPGTENSKLPPAPRLRRAGKTQMSKRQLKTQIYKKYNIKDQYFIYIGTLQPRKNLTRLIKSFSILIRQLADPDIQLIIAGKKGWLYKEIFEKVKLLGLENKIIFTGYISPEDKYILLRNALAFVLPSLYEGFGLPVLEAMQAGCPVIVPKTSSFPEVAGKAAIYIEDSFNTQSIYQSLVKMVKLGHKERKDLIKQGFIQLNKFSWEKTAQKTLAILTKQGGSGVLF